MEISIEIKAFSFVGVLLAGVACSSSKTDATSRHQPSSKDGGAEAAAAPFSPPTPDTCITDVTPGTQSLTCETLRFDLTVPDVCATEACGLITDVHGLGMNGALQEQHSKMQEQGRAHGYIVLQPSAPGMIGTSSWSSTNDPQVFALMNHVIDVWHVDQKRIHFDGYSEGGWMTWRFVCAHSDILASAAPLSGGFQPAGGITGGACTFSGTEMPVRKIPILYTHGRNDGLVLFPTAIEQRDAVVAAWFPGIAPEIVTQASDYEWDRYSGTDGSVFEFVQHDWECAASLGTIMLKGHCFPGSNQFLGCGRKDAAADGGVDYPFTWSDTVMKFFIAHPMK